MCSYDVKNVMSTKIEICPCSRGHRAMPINGCELFQPDRCSHLGVRGSQVRVLQLNPKLRTGLNRHPSRPQFTVFLRDERPALRPASGIEGETGMERKPPLLKKTVQSLLPVLIEDYSIVPRHFHRSHGLSPRDIAAQLVTAPACESPEATKHRCCHALWVHRQWRPAPSDRCCRCRFGGVLRP